MSIKFCPECGEELKNDPKFCPNCGAKLSGVTEERASIRSETSRNTNAVVICPVCGEENPADAFDCESCGAALKKGKRPERKQNKNTSSGVSKKLERTGDKTAVPSTSQYLDRNRIIIVGAAVVILLLILLYSSGMFDSAPQVAQNEIVQQQGASGVDLSNLEKINEMQAQVNSNPQDMKLLLELAHLKNDAGLLDQAIQDYKNYLKSNPKDADARIDMGVCYYKQQKYTEAIAEMKEALKYSPDHQIGHLNLGIVNLAAGNIEESKKWLTKAVALNPNNDIGKRAQELLQSH